MKYASASIKTEFNAVLPSRKLMAGETGDGEERQRREGGGGAEGSMKRPSGGSASSSDNQTTERQAFIRYKGAG